MINTLLFLTGGLVEIALSLLLGPTVFILIALALRPLALWYFKINLKENLLKQQNDLLRSIHDQLAEQNSGRSKVD